MTKSVEEKYKVLDELEHIRKRPGIYIGSTVNHSGEEYIFNQDTSKMELAQISYNPGLLKCFSEVLDNSVDEHKRNPTKLNVIRVDIDEKAKSISIQDNGGIPVKIHSELNLYVPEVIFGVLRSGSNYDDSEDQQLIGTNGLGSKLASIFSTWFCVETADGENYFKQVHRDGMSIKEEPKVVPSDKHFTKITFIPDYAYFGCDLNKDLIAKIIKRVVDCAGCNQSIKFYINGKLIKIASFRDYISMYADEFEFDATSDWQIGVVHSDRGFQQVSFVNSVETYDGGTHVDYVANQFVNGLREFIKKKHKVDVKPADIKQHIQLIISCNINRPKFNSQTKSFMISEVRDYKTSYSASDKFIKTLTKSPIIQSVMDWVAAKEAANERAELRKLNKDLDRSNPKRVPKFDDATTKNRDEAILFLCEGDSAKNGIMAGRDPRTMGVFPLRGKPKNVHETSVIEVTNNVEFKNILTITGLQLGVSPLMEESATWFKTKIEDTEYVINGNDKGVIIKGVHCIATAKVPCNPTPQEQHKYSMMFKAGRILRRLNIRFGRIAFATDADTDGFHIRFLLADMFRRFWPELYSVGVINILNTPLAKVKHKSTVLEFYTLDDYEKWCAAHQNDKYVTKYYKGLGSSSDKEWKEYLSQGNLDKNLVRISIESPEDTDIFTLLFSKQKGMTDKRKEWLGIEDAQ